MKTNFQIQLKRVNGNPHFILAGDFDASSAWDLINLLEAHHTGEGQLLIDTQGLREIYPFGCSIFKSQCRRRKLSPDCLVFRGEKGMEIAPEGSRCLHAPNNPPCRCQGDCRNCSCSHQAAEPIDRPGVQRKIDEIH